MEPVLSLIARRRKLEYFFGFVPRSDRILEIGCAAGWVGAYATAHGWDQFVGIDLVRPATPPPHEFILGDVRDWAALGLRPASFDTVVAFEVLEYGDFFDAIGQLLRPGGLLLVTTPVPHRDWVGQLLERVGLNQRRTSPHTHLTDLRDFPLEFAPVRLAVRAGLSQWGVFQRVARPVVNAGAFARPDRPDRTGRPANAAHRRHDRG